MMDLKLLINGFWQDASDGSHLESLNPATNEVLGTYPCATHADVDAVLSAAQSGKRVWGGMSFRQRSEVLLNAADIMEEYSEELAELICSEVGKPINMARGEVAELPSLFRSCVAAGTHQLGAVFPNHECAGDLSDVAFTVTEPLGVVVCMGPFNFPLSTLTFKTAPALTMGNSIIIKAPSEAPLTVLRYAELLNGAGFPPGVVQAIAGSGAKLGEWLLCNDLVDAVGFTGSTAVGTKLLEYSAPYFHRTLLELGGNDVLLITGNADLEKAVDQSMIRCANAGQICCAPKRFLIHNSVKEQYLEHLVSRVKDLKQGDPADPSSDLGCLVSEAAAENALQQIRHTITQGGKLLCGGGRQGAFLEPTVLECTKDMDIARDMEVFAPVWAVIGYDTEEEAVEIANASVYGLNSGVIAGSVEQGIQLAKQLEAGTVVANGHGLFRRDTGCFGGYKHSGMGREGILDLLSEYSQRKIIVVQLA